MTIATATSCTHTYKGDAEINFILDDPCELQVTIDTERLHIRSIKGSDSEEYVNLFGDKRVMRLYATGQTKTKEETLKRINESWIKRWKNQDPYSALAIYLQDKDTFLGHVVLGYGEKPWQSELAYLFHESFHGMRYGTEAVTPVVKEYAPATVEEGYKLKVEKDDQIIETTLAEITATSHTDNIASNKILDRLGMKLTHQSEMYGGLRNHYEIALSELPKPSRVQ